MKLFFVAVLSVFMCIGPTTAQSGSEPQVTESTSAKQGKILNDLREKIKPTKDKIEAISVVLKEQLKTEQNAEKVYDDLLNATKEILALVEPNGQIVQALIALRNDARSDAAVTSKSTNQKLIAMSPAFTKNAEELDKNITALNVQYGRGLESVRIIEENKEEAIYRVKLEAYDNATAKALELVAQITSFVDATANVAQTLQPLTPSPAEGVAQ